MDRDIHNGKIIDGKIVYSPPCICSTCLRHYKIKISNIINPKYLNVYYPIEKCFCYSCSDTYK